ncbi:hypothetical protein GCM10012280_57610 [Wenjunlia tyrosinilytica]|uniref:Uncharacterized protein n=1 Tax=Wenjunlia tyrosinilytica TaxID=1544741 RepID=A0A918E1N8_9ACTN|nr:hypothetical protein GCM10012280_57610 [Wenjunlia tyrosinilytica]
MTLRQDSQGPHRTHRTAGIHGTAGTLGPGTRAHAAEAQTADQHTAGAYTAEAQTADQHTAGREARP